MNVVAGSISGLALLLLVGGLGMVGCPHYNVYTQEMEGRAKLAEAESSRKIVILESESKKASAKNLADANIEAAKGNAVAEVERAKGVAEANRIIGESLRGHDEYLRYLWITNLEAGAGRETVYVPTEAGLPVLEANRLNRN